MCSEAEYPQYLLPDEEKYSGKDGRIDFRALTDKETLLRYVAKLSESLHHPVSIWDINREQMVEHKDTSSSRADSSIRTACTLLRKCAGSRFCKLCDEFHAKCMGADTKETKQRIHSSVQEPLEFFYEEYRKNPPEVYAINERPVIEYHCPMLGYRELIFPVRFGQTVVGVLFAGQIIVSSEEDMKTNRVIRECFFAKNQPEHVFESYVNAYNQYHQTDTIQCDSIKKLIMDVDGDTDQYDRILNFDPNEGSVNRRYYFKNFESKEDFDAFKKEVCESLGRLEIALYAEYENKRRRYFERVIGSITDEFMVQYRKAVGVRHHNAHDQRAAELRAVWNALEIVAERIKESFSYIESVTVFGDGETLTIKDIKLKMAQFSTDGKSDGQSLFFSGPNQVENAGYETSVKNPDLLRCLKPEEKRENRIVIHCRDIALALEVSSLSEHTTLYGTLADAIGGSLIRINSIIALCTANLTKEKHLLTLRMNRHENAHISERLADTLDEYFGDDGQRFLGLGKEKQKLVVNDLQNTIRLISNASESLGVVIGSIDENSPLVFRKTTVDVIDMQYKWQNMFHDMLVDRSLEIMIPRSSDMGKIGAQLSDRVNLDNAAILDDNRAFAEGDRKIRIQKDLFELLVYNLVDNAVKYAYRGTNIYLIWRKIDGVHELSVVNYGPQIEEGDRPYGLYYRGNPQGVFATGDGLGLYVVKRISQIIGVKCSHTCRKVSDYNIPLISWYKVRQTEGESAFQSIEAEKLDDYDRTMDRIIINQYEETRLKKVTKKRLLRRIESPTYSTIFTVRIN